MKVLIMKASNDYFYEIREMTAEQILKLTEEFKKEIVVRKVGRKMNTFDRNYNKIELGLIDYKVVIYDDYLE